MRTIVFTVHEQPSPPADRIERAERLEFIRDGFSPFAAAIPPLWMAMNRLWIALLIYLLVSTGLSLALATMGVDKTLIGLINLAANIVIGFEASSLQRWTLGRRDWSEIGTVVGRNRSECERRFFDGWLIGQPVLRRSTMMAAPAITGGPGTGGVRDLPFDSTPDSQEPDATISPRRSLWRRLLRR